jgi:hypothetical protein
LSEGGVITSTDNLFFDIGYLSSSAVKKFEEISLPYSKEKLSRRLPFVKGTISMFQEVGIFLINNDLAAPGMVNIFKGNHFRKIYAQDAGIYAI